VLCSWLDYTNTRWEEQKVLYENSSPDYHDPTNPINQAATWLSSLHVILSLLQDDLWSGSANFVLVYDQHAAAENLAAVATLSAAGTGQGTTETSQILDNLAAFPSPKTAGCKDFTAKELVGTPLKGAGSMALALAASQAQEFSFTPIPSALPYYKKTFQKNGFLCGNSTERGDFSLPETTDDEPLYVHYKWYDPNTTTLVVNVTKQGSEKLAATVHINLFDIARIRSTKVRG